jgi:AraC-like DNA-binding protein
LAALGYGTQFCPDFEFGAAEQRVVDTPIDGRRIGWRRAESGRVTPRQLEYLRDMARRLGMSEEELEARAQEQFGTTLADLGRQEASALIESLRQRRNVHEAA